MCVASYKMGQVVNKFRSATPSVEEEQQEMSVLLQVPEETDDETDAALSVMREISLQQAARNGNEEQVAWLLSQKASVNMKDKKGLTALHYAVQYTYEGVVKMLILNGADLEVGAGCESGTALHIAAGRGCARVVKLLLDPREHLQQDRAEDGSFIHGAAVDSEDNNGATPLHFACKSGDEDTVKTLLDHGANINKEDHQGQVPLHWVSSHAHIVTLLLDYGADAIKKDKYGHTPLSTASHFGHDEIAAKLLDTGMDVNEQDNTGRTSLHIASSHGHKKTVAVLLEHPGTDINKLDDNTEIALHSASQHGRVDIASLLLENKADVNRRNLHGKTPLHVACQYGHLDTVIVLLEHGADVDEKDDKGKTPVHYACYYGRVRIVEFLLLRKGVSFAEADDDNYTPLMSAIRKGHEDVVEAIVKSKRWEKLFKTTQNKTTPMREAITRMPVAAALVLDRCITCDGKFVKYDYELIEDFQDPKSVPLPAVVEKYAQIFFPENGGKSAKWGPQGYDRVNHPLKLMAESGNVELLQHPLVTRLVNSKWKLPRFLYIVSMLLHCFFVILLTTLALAAPSPLSESCLSAFNTTAGNATDVFDCEQSSSRRHFIYSAAVLVFITALFRLVFLETIEIVYYQVNYFLDWQNWLKLVMLPFAIIFVSVFNAVCLCAHQWQWQIGTVAVFLAWIDLLLAIRKSPSFGIYVAMMEYIVKRFIKTIPIILLLVIAFGFGFYMLFFDPGILRSHFSTPARSLLSVVTYSAGGSEYGSLFHLGTNVEDNELEAIHFPAVSYIFWIVFIIIMPILMNNMLIGLAVGDIAELLQRAETRIESMKIDLILDVEANLPEKLRRKFIVLQHKEKENKDMLQEVKEFPEQTLSLDQLEISQLAMEVHQMKNTMDKILKLLEKDRQDGLVQ